MKPGYWGLAPATETHFRSWSYGVVTNVNDLYAPRIFGARRNLVCECGALRGEGNASDTCSHCWVEVESDTREARRRRMGRVELPCHWKNPLTDTWYTEFPIIPVGFRASADDEPNVLGMAYEELIRVKLRLSEALPPKDDERYIAGGFLRGHPDLDAVMLRIFLGGASGAPLPPDVTLLNDGCLLWLLVTTLIKVDLHVASVARACGLALESATRI